MVGERPVWSIIRDRIDLVRIVTELLGPPAKRSGRRLLWRCPFHDDHSPSLGVDTAWGTWKCWPCGLGGDAATLIMKVNRLTFPETVKWLAERAGVVSPARSDGPMSRPKAVVTTVPAKAPTPTPESPKGLGLDDASALVSEAAQRLWGPDGAEALAYLRRRGLTDATIADALLGWTPGITLPTRDGGRAFQARGVVIPWFDADRLVKVAIRQPDGNKPKYVAAFTDGPRVYAGTEAIRPGYPLVICEGELDCLILSQQIGDLAAVVTPGGASARPTADILVDLMPAAPWFAAHDTDGAGDRAASDWPRAIRVRPPGPGKDWTDAHMSGTNRLRYLWGGILGSRSSWEGLESLRWGPMADGTASDDDGYAEAERAAIQAECGE
jgi:DNA primase